MSPTRTDPRPYRRNTEAKFWSFVDKSAGRDGCWPWQRPLHDGYGHFKYEFKNWGAHRLAYVFIKGDPAPGLVIDHLCRNRACCNPDHMEPVTNAENVLRGEGHSATNARATRCINGHEFSQDNTRMTSSGRACVTCSRKREREARARRAALIAADPSLAEHGKTATYTSWRCRCPECKAAWSEYMREYYARRVETRELRAA